MTKSDQTAALRELLRISQPKTRLSDLMLAAKVRERLERLLLEQREQALLAEHGLSPMRRLLLTGPPATGKTSTARALAGELGLPLCAVCAWELLSCSPERAAATLRLTFQAMSSQRGVYLFDEFDTVGVNIYKGSDAAEQRRLLELLFQRIEADRTDSIIIVVVNDLEPLTTERTWRFDDVLEYDKPDSDQIWSFICARYSRYPQIESWPTQLAGLRRPDARMQRRSKRSTTARRNRSPQGSPEREAGTGHGVASRGGA
jgi:SpoVK/Ycf46/Vps4 family AAA+-type ATPase